MSMRTRALTRAGRRAADARQTGVSGSLAVPVFASESGQVVGTLGIGKFAPYEFTGAEKQRLAARDRMQADEGVHGSGSLAHVDGALNDIDGIGIKTAASKAAFLLAVTPEIDSKPLINGARDGT